MILLVTNRKDVTTDFVVAALRERGAKFVRLNTEDLLREWTLRWSLCGWEAYSQRGQHIVGADVTAVYYRRPRDPNPLHGTARDAGAFAVREAKALLQGMLTHTDASWISPPSAIRAAEDKLTQLRAASELGFRVPETVVTNDPEVARTFAARRPAIVKPLSSGFLSNDPPQIAYTQALNDHATFDDVAVCPHLLQERANKNADIRVTVVDSTVFACRIDSQAYADTSLDWRRATSLDLSLAHSIVDLDAGTAQKCATLVRSLGLRFGAIDLVEDAGGYVFLEINPNGQWAWIEQRTGAPISAAIAEALISVKSHAVIR